MRMSESWSDRVRKDEESSHAAWFSAAKKQWLESGKRSDVPDAFLDGAKRGSRTVIVAQEDDNEIASVPTMVDVEIPSFTKAPAGHVVYNVKVGVCGMHDGYVCVTLCVDLWFVCACE